MKRKHYTHAQRRHWRHIQRVYAYDRAAAMRLAWDFGRMLADKDMQRERRAA